MAPRMDSNEARLRWRKLLDGALSGADAVIERYGAPVAAVIPYADYEALAEELEDLRAARRAAAAYQGYRENPDTAVPYATLRQEAIAEGRLRLSDESQTDAVRPADPSSPSAPQ